MRSQGTLETSLGEELLGEGTGEVDRGDAADR